MSLIIIITLLYKLYFGLLQLFLQTLSLKKYTICYINLIVFRSKLRGIYYLPTFNFLKNIYCITACVAQLAKSSDIQTVGCGLWPRPKKRSKIIFRSSNIQ